LNHVQLPGLALIKYLYAGLGFGDLRGHTCELLFSLGRHPIYYLSKATVCILAARGVVDTLAAVSECLHTRDSRRP
jgi:hypothetical protein